MCEHKFKYDTRTRRYNDEECCDECRKVCVKCGKETWELYD